MGLLFIEYPRCSTCKKAKAFLLSHEVAFEERNIVEQPPTAEEIKLWQSQSGRPLKAFFNTSGQSYRNLGLKDKMATMPEEEQRRLLAADGMLIKRPILVGKEVLLLGFKEAEWEETLAK